MSAPTPDPRLTPKRSGRGFANYDPVVGAYGGEARVYESSAASGPHLWLSVWSHEDANNRTGRKESTLHLSLEEAEVLRDQLTHLIDNHYQL